jgi:hypothetical protein
LNSKLVLHSGPRTKPKSLIYKKSKDNDYLDIRLSNSILLKNTTMRWLHAPTKGHILNA